MTCVDCGRRTRGRRCRHCEREERIGVGSDPVRTYLTSRGPHRCDVCGEVVATLAALRMDCAEHGPDRDGPGTDDRTGPDPTDLDVFAGDVRAITRQRARQTGRDPFELQIVAARALLRASRERANGEAARAAIGSALDWTTASKLAGDSDA